MPETQLTSHRYCLECGNPISGRNDKKFCNDICRTAYNNEKRKQPGPPDENSYLDMVEMPAIQKIYLILLNNRAILYNLAGYSGLIIPLRDLLGHGFNLKYFTSETIEPDGKTYRYCFDFGYHIRKDREVDIIYRAGEIFTL